MAKCSQCGKDAVVAIGSHPLCINCWLKFEHARQSYMTLFMQEMNNIVDSMEATFGISGLLPRYKIPQPTIHQGPLTLNNIKVDNSIVGSINTGEIEQLDIAMNHFTNQGNKELVQSMKEFTEAVLAEASFNSAMKNQIVDQLVYLTAQSALPKEKRKPGVIKSVLSGIKDSVGTVGALVTIWDKLQPLLTGLLS